MDILKLEEICIELKSLQSTLILIENSTYSNSDMECMREALELVNGRLYDSLNELTELKNIAFKHESFLNEKNIDNKACDNKNIALVLKDT